jgi:hypothetical protein
MKYTHKHNTHTNTHIYTVWLCRGPYEREPRIQQLRLYRELQWSVSVHVHIYINTCVFCSCLTCVHYIHINSHTLSLTHPHISFASHMHTMHTHMHTHTQSERNCRQKDLDDIARGLVYIREHRPLCTWQNGMCVCVLFACITLHAPLNTPSHAHSLPHSLTHTHSFTHTYTRACAHTGHRWAIWRVRNRREHVHMAKYVKRSEV